MTTPGVYIADLTLAEGSWQMRMDIVAGDSEGTVEFTEVVGGTPMSQPVVRVDTADPGRQGSTVAESSVFEAPAQPVDGPETDIDVRVEALVRDAVAPLVIEYGVVTGVTDATVSISALSDGSEDPWPCGADGVGRGRLPGCPRVPRWWCLGGKRRYGRTGRGHRHIRREPAVAPLHHRGRIAQDQGRQRRSDPRGNTDRLASLPSSAGPARRRRCPLRPRSRMGATCSCRSPPRVPRSVSR